MVLATPQNPAQATRTRPDPVDISPVRDLHVLVGAFVAYETAHLRRRAPSTAVALLAFFLVGGAALLDDPDPLLGYERVVAGILDLVTVAVLLVLVFAARKLVRGALHAVDEAHYRAQEYERATQDLAALVDAAEESAVLWGRPAASTGAELSSECSALPMAAQASGEQRVCNAQT